MIDPMECPSRLPMRHASQTLSSAVLHLAEGGVSTKKWKKIERTRRPEEREGNANKTGRKTATDYTDFHQWF